MLRILELHSLRTHAALFALAATATFASHAQATPINYGDLSGNTVDYKQITETSATDPQYFPPNPPLGLFGAPSVSGDSLDFNPQNFFADSNFQSPAVDTTDGYLQFGVNAKANHAIQSISFQEGGALSIGGFGSDSTYVDVSAVGFINVFEVDGVAISSVAIPIDLKFNFGSNGPQDNGTWRLGTEGAMNGFLWTGYQSIDIKQWLLTNTNIPVTYGATKISIALDNILKAQSEQLAGAFIDKKDFGGLSVTVNAPVIPEPATWLLVMVCGSLLGIARRVR